MTTKRQSPAGSANASKTPPARPRVSPILVMVGLTLVDPSVSPATTAQGLDGAQRNAPGSGQLAVGPTFRSYLGPVSRNARGIQAGQPQPVTPEDLFSIQEVTEPQVHPDGRQVAFVVTRMDRDSNAYRSSIWVADAETGETRRLTSGLHRDRSPRWSPDGNWIAFISSRSGSSQLWIMATRGGEAGQLTNLKGGASNPRWAPDSRGLVVVSDVAIETTPANRLMGSTYKPEAQDVKVLDRLRYRAGTSYFGSQYPHLFVVPLGGGPPRQLTDGPHEDSDPAWSPDGQRIAFVSNRTDEPDFNRNTDIWVVDAAGGPARRFAGGPGTDGSPEWSQDGKWLAYRGNQSAHDYGSQFQVSVVESGGGESRSVTKAVDRSASGFHWGPGSQLLIAFGNRGNVELHTIGLGGDDRVLIAGKGQVADFEVDPKGRVIYLWTTPTAPGELYVLPRALSGEVTRKGTDAPTEGGSGRVLSRFNDEWRVSRRLVDPEELWYQGADNWKIQGWVMAPVGLQPNRHYPLILNIHGGPYGMYGNEFDLEFQVLAAQGWAVLFTNPRGSTGYGQEFEHAVTGDLGGKAYEDLMRGVDAALGRYPWVDTQRLGVAGGSYGGFMTNWVLGHTERFAAAVTDRSISNWLSFYGTADIPSWVEVEHGDPPWKSPLRLWEDSPLAYADRIKTPTLIIHSELDFRVPVSQAEELHRALMRRGVATLFIRFPGEGHDLSRSGQPLHRLERLRWMVRWFQKYLGKQT